MEDKRLIVMTVKYRGDVFQTGAERGQTIYDLKTTLVPLISLGQVRQRIIHQGKILKDVDEITEIFEDTTLEVVRLADNSTIQEEQVNHTPAMSKVQKNLFEQMSQIPLIKNLATDEAFLKSMITSNPQIKKMMEKNPEIESLMNDPSLLKDSLESMKNPLYYQEFTRSQDRLLNNLETHPEGFNTLLRAYKTTQKPMMDALSDVTDSPPSITLNTIQHAPESTIDSPFPNPWGPKIQQYNTPDIKKPVDDVPDVIKYKQQLSSLSEMGFPDSEKNVEVLKDVAGDLFRAIERLLNNNKR